MSRIHVYDEMMGSGKTSRAIERMEGYIKEDKKFIYIVPYLNEIERIRIALPLESVKIPLSKEESNKSIVEVTLDFVDENGMYNLNIEKKFKKLNKRAQFLKFVSNGDSVLTTHSIFKSLKKEDVSLLKDYVIILDEVIDPLDIVRIGKKDIEILKEQYLIIVDETTNQVRFIDDEYNDPAFKKVKELCTNSTVYCLDNHFFVWMFPIEIFKEVEEIQILTYLFEGSLLSAYLKMHSFQYIIYNNSSYSDLEKIKSLLNIYEGSANDQKNSLNSFSKTWSKNLNKNTAKKFSYKASNIIKRNFKTDAKYNAFTTFIDYKSKFSGSGYARGFISVNARATNDFKHIKSMIYLANRFYTPQQINFFRERGIDLNEDLWALSELVQWIWRGCIREGKEMNLYIPSYRMRSLLYRWLNGEFSEDSILKIKKDIA
tara:strand:- start:6483 stop:7772 length:1290 start_codon:yes stop_codon:yes gene_type:complete